MEIQIVGPEPALQSEMRASRPREPVPGVTATWQFPLAKTAGLPELIHITLHFVGEAIPAAVVVDWIMTKFRGRSEKLVINVINRKEIKFDRGELTAIIKEAIALKRTAKGGRRP